MARQMFVEFTVRSFRCLPFCIVGVGLVTCKNACDYIIVNSGVE